MDLSRLTLGERIVLAAGVVLIIDLLFLPWHSVAGFSLSGVEAPNAIFGIIALLVTFVMVGQIAAVKLMNATLPDPPVPWSQVHLILGGVVLGALLLKLVVETTALGFGAFLGLVLAAAVAFGAYSMRTATTV